MGAQGTAVLDFSSALGDYASVAVTGQAAILATSKVEAFFMGSTTVDSDEEDHLMAAHNVKLVCGIPVAGTGFTIYAFVEQGLTKNTFNVSWVWN